MRKTMRAALQAAANLGAGLRGEPPWQFSRRRDFTAGETLKLLPEDQAKNQLLSARNMVLNPDGLPETRLGKRRLNEISLGAGRVKAMHRYSKEDGTKYLVVQHVMGLYAVEWDGTSPILFGDSIKAVDPARLRKAIWKDQLLLTNGADFPFRFDGTTCTDLAGSPPKSKFIAIYASRAWLVDVDYPNLLRYSELENYDDWPALNVIKIRDGDGDVITGLSTSRDALLIHKNKTIWPLYGTNPQNFRLGNAPISPYVGCVAPDSLLDDGLLVGKDNIYSFSLEGVTAIADTHTPLFKTLGDLSGAFAIAHPKTQRAYVHIGAQTLCIDSRYNGAITTWIGINAGCFEVAEDRGDEGTLLIGDADDGIIYALDNDVDDDGTPIQTIWQPLYDDLEKAGRKIWRDVRPEIDLINVNQKEYSYEVMYDVDYGSTQFSLTVNQDSNPSQANGLVWDSGFWDESTWIFPERVGTPFNFCVEGVRISFAVRTTDRVRILGYESKYRLKARW